MSLLLELPDDVTVACIDSSLRQCMLLARTSKLVRVKLQRAAPRGLRVIARDVKQAFMIKKLTRGGFHIGDLVLTCSVWPFWPDWTVTIDLFGSFDKLHTVHVETRSMLTR